MTRILASILLASLANGQAATLTLGGPATARPGTSITLPLTHDAAGAVGFQWTLTSPWTPANALSVTGKTLSCDAFGKMCLVWSANTVLIPIGPLANITLAIPAAQTPGPVTLTIGGTFIVNAAGNAIVSVGSTKTITIISPADLTGDGRVDLLDVQASVNAIIGAAASCDLNSDGRCDILDCFWVVLRCTALNCQ